MIQVYFFMARQQKYGIRFPFNIISDDKTLLDLNLTKSDRIKSELMHCIFTPKGQRLRNPDFGSRLIQFIFNPNDGDTWGDIVSEIKTMVKKWIPECNLQNIDIYETDDGLGLVADIKYNVTEDDGTTISNRIITNL